MKLQDVFEEALTVWLAIREQNAAGMSVFFVQTSITI
jgi:hypothetical protein